MCFLCVWYFFFFFKQKTAYEMRISDWSSDVCSSDLVRVCGRWGLSPQDLHAVPEHQATVAYTRFVLDCGAAGDLLDLHVALAPCVIGYAEIGLDRKSVV